MERLKYMLYHILFPHIALVLLVTPIAAVLLIYSLAVPNVNKVIVYTSYIFSFYALVLVCLRIPGIYKQASAFKKENRYLLRYASDVHLRVKLSLSGSLAVNILYALFQLFCAFYYQSVWFYALTGYYALLVVMRGFLLYNTLKSVPGQKRMLELKWYRFCGVLLLLMNLSLSVVVTYIVGQNRGFEYHYIHTIAMAAYTFTTMTVAVINVIRYRRYDSPLLSAAKAISLAAALVSMISLETAMFAAFGEEDSLVFRQTLTACTGAGVCMFILAMAIYMIIGATRAIKAWNRETNFER